MVNAPLSFVRPSVANLYQSQNIQGAPFNPTLRHVACTQVRQPQISVPRQAKPPMLMIGGLKAPSIDVPRFTTPRMAARPLVTRRTTADDVQHVMRMPPRPHGQFQWNSNKTRTLEHRVTARHTKVPVTDMTQSMPLPAFAESTQQQTYSGRQRSGVATENKDHWKPATELFKINGTQNFREETARTVKEEEPNSGRLVAIDFDKTLAEVFLWAELGGLKGPEVQLRNLYKWFFEGKLLAAFGGQQRIHQIRSVLQQCKERGDLLCILSSGYSAVIRPALRMMKLNDLIPDELVYGSDTLPYGVSKSQRIDSLKREHDRVCATLIDDDMGYCRIALQEGHDVIWVKNAAGAQQREFNALINHKWDPMEYLTHLQTE